MKVHFADVVAEVRKFTYKGTYDGSLEGSYEDSSQYILERLMNDAQRFDGWVVLPSYRNKANTELKDFQYYVFARTDYEHSIFIYWFGEEMNETRSIVEVIEEITRGINFMDKCRFLSLDDLY
ncbi:MAG: hypothetical protein MJZ84_05385 [Paludibacteraceae bacterium]|nr:hypothetical protein [Paludibacteraceae bacterium]